MSAQFNNAMATKKALDETHVVLSRIGKLMEYDYMLTTSDDLPEEKRLSFWTEQLEDARMAETIHGYNAEEKRAWNQHLAELRARAIDALRAIGKFSVMLWEQMSEGEEFELNPERYWCDIIRKAKQVKEEEEDEEVEAPPPLPTPAEPTDPMLAAGAYAYIPPLNTRLVLLTHCEKHNGWARDVHSILEEVKEQLISIKEDKELVGLVKELMERAAAEEECANLVSDLRSALA
jgi:hypothetical protein